MFLTLEVTEIVLSIGFFTEIDNVVKAGGIIGVVTAAVAWYTSAAGVLNGMAGRKLAPVGGPIWKEPPSVATTIGPELGPELKVDHPGAKERVW